MDFCFNPCILDVLFGINPLALLLVTIFGVCKKPFLRLLLMELWIFLAALYVIYLLFFKKKKNKTAGVTTSKTFKAPPKEWIADIKKKETVVRNDDSEDDNLATFTDLLPVD